MKKRFALLGLIFISLLVLSCTPQIPKVAEETSTEEVPAAVAEKVSIINNSLVAEEIKTTEPEYSVIYPKLKYEGAYNGPLYGTSEQVGSASMDTYYELLD